MDPILLDIPYEITTERLLLRAPRQGDGAVVNAAIVETAKELALWMPWARPTPAVADTEKYCRQARAKFEVRSELHFLLFDRRDGSFVGGCGFHDIDWALPRFEIGYWVRNSRVGNGYITEAVQKLTTMATDTLGAVRIEIRADDDNVRSCRTAERAGFRLDGVLRNWSRDGENRLHNMRVYSKVAGD